MASRVDLQVISDKVFNQEQISTHFYVKTKTLPAIGYHFNYRIRKALNLRFRCSCEKSSCSIAPCRAYGPLHLRWRSTPDPSYPFHEFILLASRHAHNCTVRHRNISALAFRVLRYFVKIYHRRVMHPDEKSE
jgi:hypothetical protein